MTSQPNTAVRKGSCSLSQLILQKMWRLQKVRRRLKGDSFCSIPKARRGGSKSERPVSRIDQPLSALVKADAATVLVHDVPE